MRVLLCKSFYLVASNGLSMVLASQSAAQGITSAAVTGIVTKEGGAPLEGALVSITNASTGTRLATAAAKSGRFNFENVPPGGPFTIAVRAIGFEPATKTGVMLTLGQRYPANFELAARVITLQELTVVAATNPLINSGRTGPAQIVTDSAIQRYPLLGRNLRT